MTRRRSPEGQAEARARRASVTDSNVVMEAAAAFLAVRPRSVQETRQRLVSLGYEGGLVETVVERLIQIGYLDDEEFARAWVESRDRARPRGEHALRMELGRKGIERQTIDAVLEQRTEAIQEKAALVAEADPEVANDPTPKDADIAAAERLMARRRSALLREPDPRKRRAKAYALLARNGFDPDVCRSVAARIDDDTETNGQEEGT